ncbi:MAG TPA: acyltransferase [Candidatus Thermoplasmatota archaeon]|nr:acyltransferase [Candidatus Thermoplasmatota archaeon]
MRRTTTRESPGPANSLQYWRRIVPLRRVARNWLCNKLARDLPSFRAKNWLYRRMGVKVGDNVSVAWAATMDVLFPELITLEDDCIVGYNTTILTHEFLRREWRTGPVVVGKGATIGANCTILPGVKIAPGAVVSAHSLVNSDVEGFVGGVPARPLRQSGREAAAESKKEGGVGGFFPPHGR